MSHSSAPHGEERKEDQDPSFSGFYKLSTSRRREVLAGRSVHSAATFERLTRDPSLAQSRLFTTALPRSFVEAARRGSSDEPWNTTSLRLETADTMVENCVGVHSLPLGVAPTFVVNGAPRIVPMATEEPSVIAAASSAAKTLCPQPESAASTSTKEGTGFGARVSERSVVHAQIQIRDCLSAQGDSDSPLEERLVEARGRIEANATVIVDEANKFCGSMKKRGGGCIGIFTRLIRAPGPAPPGAVASGPIGRQAPIRIKFNDDISPETSVRQGQILLGEDAEKYIEESHRPEANEHGRSWLVIHARLDVRDSMGANCASTVGEGISPLVSSLIKGLGLEVGIRIVSNYCVERRATAWFRAPLDKLAYKGFAGEVVASRIVDANEWAKSDIFRAATHNKGIMNGVDAVAIATGQDWRAIEASMHAHAAVLASQSSYSSSSSSSSSSFESNVGYRALTEYYVEDGYLVGILDAPLAAGTRGGAVHAGPESIRNLAIMGNPTSSELCEILAAVGLAQNFCALRALVTEGIQRGHMDLHRRKA